MRKVKSPAEPFTHPPNPSWTFFGVPEYLKQAQNRYPSPWNPKFKTLNPETQDPTIGAWMITNTILGVPYDDYSLMGPKTLF